MKINALNLDYKTLNKKIHSAIASGEKHIHLAGVNGQRFIASGIDEKASIRISGVPGNDLGSFMNGPIITLDGNAQDAVGNTMSGGKIIINGHAGDAIGYSMRGGKIFIRGNAGYRVGIHMKEFRENVPIIVIGGKAKDFLGEYMAGGIITVLGLTEKIKTTNSLFCPTSDYATVNQNPDSCCGNYLATGMHGGVIYIPRDKMPPHIPKGLRTEPLSTEDKKILDDVLKEFTSDIKSLSATDKKHIHRIQFIKIHPASHRPYGNLYAY